MFASTSSRNRSRQTAIVESMDGRRYCDADNSIGSAADLGTVSAYTAKTGNLTSKTDTKDFYKFVVPVGSKNFGVKAGSLGKNADLYLYNSSKSQIASSKNSGTTSEVIIKTLTPGTYYAEVRAKDTNSATTSYSLKLMSDAAGNDKAAARDTGVINNGGANKLFSDYAGSLDLNDYYKFDTGGGKISIDLTSLSGDADVALVDYSGITIANSTNSGSASENIVKDLSAGSYYIRVYPFSASVDTKYNLSFKSTASDTGNTRATATSVSSPFTASETIGAGDTYDFYKINVPDFSYITMSLTTTNNPVTLAFYGEDGSLIDYKQATSGSKAEFTYFLHTGGIRYVAAVNSGALANYSISITTQAF